MKGKGLPIDRRMKRYEKKQVLTHGLPVIIRVDGRAFHTFCRGMEKPFDKLLIQMMNHAGLALCNDVQNCRFAYLQSDEINLLLYAPWDSDWWFDNELQKITSITASIASATASLFCKDHIPKKAGKPVMFDSRAFVLPEHDLANYFISRQQDWERNSLSMLARKYYSAKQLHGKKAPDLHDMIHDAGDNWNDLMPHLRRGRAINKVEYWKSATYGKDGRLLTVGTENGARRPTPVKRTMWKVAWDIPIFTKVPEYINNHISNDYTLKAHFTPEIIDYPVDCDSQG